MDTIFNWVVTQCQGIAEALSLIHRYPTSSGKSLLHPDSFDVFRSITQRRRTSHDHRAVGQLFGRHGDIKPDNILWFPDDPTTAAYNCASSIPLLGTLKIADFGITEFSTKYAVDQRRRGFVANSPTYRAPETDLQRKGGLVSQSYDIWALGCVYLEFITWWFGGWGLIQDFNRERYKGQPDLIWFKSKDLDSHPHFTSDIFFLVEQKGKKLEAMVKPSVSSVSKTTSALPPPTRNHPERKLSRHLSYKTLFDVHMLTHANDSSSSEA